MSKKSIVIGVAKLVVICVISVFFVMFLDDMVRNGGCEDTKVIQISEDFDYSEIMKKLETTPGLTRTRASYVIPTPAVTPVHTEVIEVEEDMSETADIIIEPIKADVDSEIDVGDLISIGTFKTTSYCSCSICCGKYAEDRPLDEHGEEIVHGASGQRLKVGTSVAVDPAMIPFGTHLVIDGHEYIAQDSGSAVIGNVIDIYTDCHQDAKEYGVQYKEVFIKKGV